MNDKDDGELIRLIQIGDYKAFDELYHRYSQRILYFFYRMTGGDKQRAQDLLQDIFLKVFDKINIIDPQKNFSRWIFTVAYNMMKNEYRAQSTRSVFNKDIDPDQVESPSVNANHSVETFIDQNIFEKALLNELANFSAEHRSAFLLRFQENLSIKEISEIMGCAQGTTKSRLFYITKKLARRLQDYNPNKI